MKQEKKNKSAEKKTVLLWVVAVAVVLLLTVVAIVFANNNKKLEEQIQAMNTGQQGGQQIVESEDTEESKVTEESKKTEDSEKEEESKPTEEPEATEEPKEFVAQVDVPSALHLDGTQLCDASGKPIQLRGISTHGIGWFPKYVNEQCFREFKENWNANVVRIAMYTAENNGYCTGGNQEQLKQLVKDGVTYATNQNLYVIIDWHVLNDKNPNLYKEEAKAFFDEMSAEYKDHVNVIYEICNEPNGSTSWKEVKSYAEEVIEVIRKNDDDAIIIVGTPNWSQYVDQAAADPITTSDNIMYALHFYAATHKDNLRAQMKNAVRNGLPIFVTEYGICDASGNGAIDEREANTWVKAMDDLGISYVAWNLSNKAETSAIIKNSCSKRSGFGSDDLSDSGKWLYETLTGRSATDFTPSNSDRANNTGDSNTNNNDTQQEEPVVKDSVSVEAGNESGLEVAVELQDSWANGDGNSCNYSVIITNNTKAAVHGWNIVLQFTDDITDVQGWGGNYSIEGKNLKISNVEYNGTIGSGESTKDIGFIVTGVGDMQVVGK